METEKPTTVHITGGGMVYPPVKIKTSGKDVIASGTVNTFSDENLEIQIAQFKFIFNFIKSEEQKLEFRNEGSETLVLDLYNFNNTLGVGTSKPYRLGSLMDRALYLSFRVYAFDTESCKTVHYTFMLGESVNDNG